MLSIQDIFLIKQVGLVKQKKSIKMKWFLQIDQGSIVMFFFEVQGRGKRFCYLS
jgi:hypothetical protein